MRRALCLRCFRTWVERFGGCYCGSAAEVVTFSISPVLPRRHIEDVQTTGNRL